MVLVNHDTRESAELLAAVLKGRRGIMLIRQATRGDASAREMIPLSQTQGLWMATGRWKVEGRPDYHGVGVLPDIDMAGYVAEGFTTNALAGETTAGHPLSERAKVDRELMSRVAADPGLRRATEILLALKALRAGPAARPSPGGGS
jgi:C-terminal processing protease CtpA/Prc